MDMLIISIKASNLIPLGPSDRDTTPFGIPVIPQTAHKETESDKPLKDVQITGAKLLNAAQIQDARDVLETRAVIE